MNVTSISENTMYKLICGKTRKTIFASDRKLDVVFEHQKYRRADRVRLVEPS